jgi:thiamine kinase-like enzyme
MAFVSPPGLLVTRFIEGAPVTAEAIRTPATLGRVAQALRRVHQAGSLTATFSPFRVVEVYAETAQAHGVSLPGAFSELRARAAEIERALAGEPPCFCHNDLLNANFIDDGASIRIVDWEYAGMGDRFFDFGNFAVNHELEEAEERILLAEYFGACTPRDHARLRLMRIMSDFREATWGLVQQGISTLEVDFADYARRHFDRLLGATADPRYRHWLSACA